MTILSNILKIKLLVFGILIIFISIANFYWLPNGMFFGKEIALTTLGGLLAINLLFNRNVKFDFTLVDILITIFLLYSTTLFWLNDYHPSLFKWSIFTVSFAIYFFVIKKIKKEGKQEILVLVFIILFSIQAIIGLVQIFNKSHIPLFERSLFIKGSFSNPAPYASFLSLGLILVLSLLLFYYVNGFKKWCLIFLSFFYASMIIISASRTAIIASVLGVCFLLFRKYNLKIKRFFKKKLFGLLCILSFILGVILLAQINTDSINGRFFIWKISSEIIKDKPIAGIGPGNFQFEYMNYQSEYFENISHNTSEALLADNNNFAFNELIHITTETGIIGLFLIITNNSNIFLLWF